MRSTRLLSIIALSGLLLGACGNSGGGGGGGGGGSKDMAMAGKVDMAMAGEPDMTVLPDLRMPKKYGCWSGIQCAGRCQDQGCIDDCLGMINTPDGYDLFDAADVCSRDAAGPNGPCAAECKMLDQVCAGCIQTACSAEIMACQKDG